MQPPIPLTSKQGEHAGALFASASIVNAMEAVERDLAWFSEAFETVPEFQQVGSQPHDQIRATAKSLRPSSTSITLTQPYLQFISTVMTDKTIQRRLLQGVMKGAGFHRLTQKFIGTSLHCVKIIRLLIVVVVVVHHSRRAL